MAYDANPAATHNPTTGVVVPANWLDLLNVNFAEIGAAWTTYTPTWTSTGTAPAVGNGQLSGASIKLGKTLFIRIKIVMGSTTTYGTGDYHFALPAATTGGSSHQQQIHGKAYDQSADMNYIVAGFVNGTAYVELATHGTTGKLGQLSPFTWAQNDQIYINGVIELA